MSPGFKTSLAALAVAGLMFAPIVGTGIAYADDTSTEEATSQVATSSSDDQAKADEAAKKAAAEAAQKKADEEAEAAKAKAEQEAKDKADAEAKKAVDETAKQAEPTPTPEPEVSPTTDPTQSPTPEVAAKTKVASVNTVTYKPVSEYFDPASECEAAGIDVKAGAPDLLVEWNGGSQTVHAGDNFRVDTTASAIDFTVSIKSDSSNKVSVSIKVLQGNECPAADPDTDGDGYTDSAEKAAGSDPNDPKSTPVDLDGDGVLNESDKCPGTASGAKVDKDGCSADQQTPPNGNKGTLKIHEQGTPSGTESNDPKVCTFNLEGYQFAPGQTGYVMFDVQGGDGPTGTSAGPYNVGPANGDGYFETQYFNLSPGHYKATLYGKQLPSGQLDDEKAKSKVFKVACDTPVKAQYAVVIWQVNDYPTNSMWPQTLVDSVTGLDAPNLGYFDSLLKGKCVKYQVDVYHYDVKDGSKAKVDNLIATGHLYGSNNPPEPLISGGEGTAWKFYSNNDCTTYYDAPTIQVWDQKCVVGDQGVGQYTDGGFVVTAADKVSVVVKDGDDKVVTDTSSVKPGVYTVFATAPKGGAWNKLPDGWSYVDESKTVIKTVVTVKAAKDCSVQKPPPDPSTYVWGQETWKCYDTQAVTKGERIDYVPTWIDGAWVQVAQPPVPVEKTRLLTEEEIVKACTPDPETEAYSTTWKDGTWKCGDTTVEQTRWTATWEIPYVIQWNEDGSYAFALDYDHAVLLSNVKDTRSRDLTKDEIAPCDNGDDSGPENGNGPSIPWWLVGSLAALGGAFFLRRRLA